MLGIPGHGLLGRDLAGVPIQGRRQLRQHGLPWTFYQSITNAGSGATFNVTIHSVTGTYAVAPRTSPSASNDVQNPFDNDVAYTGATAFLITEFVE